MSYTPGNATSAQVAQLKASSTTNVRAVAAAATAAAGDEMLVTTAANAITITLPAPANAAVVVVKKVDAGSGSITVVPATPASQTIDGATSFAISAQYTSIDFVSDGTNWFIN